MSNHLSQEQSPYLLQHADNPVDWYPWGDEALQKARREDKPVFLSIGYATCHWCHVMAHESFEDPAVAGALNDNFIAIKVDREERPDLDSIYMTVCQAMTGSGGWPLNVFMTPDGKPFFAGTYFPKTTRGEMPGFLELLAQIAQLWRSDRQRVVNAGEQITQAIQPKAAVADPAQPLGEHTLKKGFEQLSRAFDPKWGGFGSAPKFPTPHHLTFLLRWYKRTGDSSALNMVEETLLAMRKGGIFDQVGLGFSRYAVDEHWLTPHFEKMLYDQAMLAMAYLEAYQVTGKAHYGQVAREIFTYVLRDMTSPEGGFYSAEDADSEGREGWFYVWTPEQVHEVLGEKLGDLFCRFYDITPSGNFEDGASIPHLRVSLEAFAEQRGMSAAEVQPLMEEAEHRLFQARARRIHPLKDDKVLTAWNGLMIAALAKGYQALGDPAHAGAARNAADFLLKSMRDASGRLFRRCRHGHVAIPGYLDDYAFMVWGLIELYEAVFDVGYLQEAVRLNQEMLDLFWDGRSGGCFSSAADHEQLIVRDKEIYDGAVPSGNSVAALNLLRLGRMTGNLLLEEKADQLLRAFSGLVRDYPMAYTQFLNALDFSLGPGQEVVIASDDGPKVAQTMINLVHRTFMPHRVLLFKPAGPEGERLSALCAYVEAMHPVNRQPTVYVCENYTCKQPITSLEDLETIIS
jgi:uncharacterized protein YyaL (SSP411 family)